MAEIVRVFFNCTIGRTQRYDLFSILNKNFDSVHQKFQSTLTRPRQAASFSANSIGESSSTEKIQ
jgi:hypothetical protein